MESKESNGSIPQPFPNKFFSQIITEISENSGNNKSLNNHIKPRTIFGDPGCQNHQHCVNKRVIVRERSIPGNHIQLSECIRGHYSREIDQENTEE